MLKMSQTDNDEIIDDCRKVLAQVPLASRRFLSGRKINVAQNKQDCEDPNQRVNFANLSGCNFYDGIRNQTKAKASGNTECKRRCQHRNERWNSFAEVMPGDLRNRLRHENPN